MVAMLILAQLLAIFSYCSATLSYANYYQPYQPPQKLVSVKNVQKDNFADETSNLKANHIFKEIDFPTLDTNPRSPSLFLKTFLALGAFHIGVFTLEKIVAEIRDRVLAVRH